jgi:hypothetical protein
MIEAVAVRDTCFVGAAVALILSLRFHQPAGGHGVCDYKLKSASSKPPYERNQSDPIQSSATSPNNAKQRWLRTFHRRWCWWPFAPDRPYDRI